MLKAEIATVDPCYVILNDCFQRRKYTVKCYIFLGVVPRAPTGDGAGMGKGKETREKGKVEVRSAMNQYSFYIVLVFLEYLSSSFSFSKRIAIILVFVFVLVTKIALLRRGRRPTVGCRVSQRRRRWPSCWVSTAPTC